MNNITPSDDRLADIGRDDPFEIDPNSCKSCGLTIDRHRRVDTPDGPEFFCEEIGRATNGHDRDPPPPAGPEDYGREIAAAQPNDQSPLASRPASVNTP